MVQLTLAYVATGTAVLLLVAGILAITAGEQGAMLSPHRRRLVIGGITGMCLFVIVLMVWLRDSLWLR
jgi:hypothetical protein